ncbi:MAG: rRNA maturation RNase YbeY [Gallionellales bacterium RBG_16_56_9]|nr:MAG: rRNA maturation RNase YbeY [Gallionellales bacterium RBG_16_56_9]
MNAMSSKNPHKLSLTVQYASAARHLPARPQLRRWVNAALQHDVRMTLRIVDEAEGRELNKNYRGKDYATNVLTFVYDDADTLSGDAEFCGDVVICAPVVEQEAAEQHKDLLAHYAHLAIHAALHLQGYDHENDTDAAEMEALETALMVKLRYPNPYQAT